MGLNITPKQAGINSTAFVEDFFMWGTSFNFGGFKMWQQ